MNPFHSATVYVVDDEEVLRDALAWLLRSRRLLPRCFASGDAFWAAVESGDVKADSPACLLLDMRMPGMNGMALFERLAERGLTERIPVIFLTGHADVATRRDGRQARRVRLRREAVLRQRAGRPGD